MEFYLLWSLLMLFVAPLHASTELTVTRSVSFNHHANYKAERAHDGNYDTWYSIKDGAVAGNFLKLYLERAYGITNVKMTSRPGLGMVRRMVNTEVRVYSTASENGETQVANCGKITEVDIENRDSIEGRTYTLNCNGAEGDMLYLTDLDYSDPTGHNLAEVKIYGIVPITIVRSEAKSWYKDDSNPTLLAPSKAYDGDYSTFYSVKDGDAVGNFLKLYLSGSFRIGIIKLTNRLDGCCAERIRDTVVKVYSGNNEAGNCGTISDYDRNKPKDVEAQTYTLNCKNIQGDMIYITDLTSGSLGHGISEVEVYKSLFGGEFRSRYPVIESEI